MGLFSRRPLNGDNATFTKGMTAFRWQRMANQE